jgi:hypothetical protein
MMWSRMGSCGATGRTRIAAPIIFVDQSFDKIRLSDSIADILLAIEPGIPAVYAREDTET